MPDGDNDDDDSDDDKSKPSVPYWGADEITFQKPVTTERPFIEAGSRLFSRFVILTAPLLDKNLDSRRQCPAS